MNRICVFCGSSNGASKIYRDAIRRLGMTLVKNNIGLVYGGGDVGLMGEIAHTVIEEGGEVIGVIPKVLFDKEVAYTNLSDLRVVNSMHERKSLMFELSDGFIAMPGGLGTIEEFFEVLTWMQLGIHEKPCGILNVNGYFDHLIQFLDYSVNQKFVNKVHRSMIIIKNNPVDLIKNFDSYKPSKVDKVKWVLSMNNA